MKLLIIHFSDIHLKEHNNSIETKIDKLYDSIKNRLKEVDKFIIITSGDIAFSGKSTEYKVAQTLYYNLKSKLNKYASSNCELIFVPGNHDCFFDKKKESLRGLAIDSFQTKGFENIDERLLEVCCEPQIEFDEFNKTNSEHLIFGLNHKLLKEYKIDFGNKVKFICYNTSWFSRLNEKPGVMGYPVNLFKEDVINDNDDIVISVLHHPFNWQNPETSREFRNHIESTSDFVLSGHEHSASKGIYNNLEGNNTLYIEAPALQESERRDNSGFNLIFFDFETSQIKIELFQWDKGHYKLKDDTGWKDFKRGIDLKKRKININEDYLDELVDAGASFTHSSANDKITLQDLFVYPNVEVLDPDDSINKSISSKIILTGDNPKGFKYLILGDETSGKTALCRYVFKDFYDKGLTPIMIKGDQINGINIEQIAKIVEKAFVQQYNKRELIFFQELDKDKIVLIIDDFHLFKTKNKAKQVFVDSINKVYQNIIICGNKIMQLEDYTDAGGGVIYNEYKQYGIQELGPDLRYEIINKWNYLGNSHFNSRNELLELNDNATRFVNDIVKKNLVPSFPFFILSMLQSLESKEHTPQYSMHGYYYQLIITKTLSKIVPDNKLGAYHNFLAQYCFFLFDEEIRFRGLAVSDFNKVFIKFCDDFEITTISNDTLLKKLKEAKILEEVDGHIRLVYKYVYYYFVAKYLSDNISDTKVIKKIRLLCERVYREEYSNIIMFLVHLEKSQLILDELLSNSKKIFNEIKPIKLDGDIDFINKLVNKLPKEIIESIDVEESRKQERIDEEESERTIKEFNEEDLQANYKLDDDISALDILSRITRALKMIEILGQVTKKHWAEIKGPMKLDLTEETYSVGLRTLGFYFTLLENNIPILVDHLKDILEKRHMKNKLDEENLKEITNEFIFKLCSTSTFSVVKRISNAIGLEDLSQTFDQVFQKNNYKSIEVINLAIKLDHFQGIPEKELFAFKENNNINYLCVNVIHNMVISYFYMFHVELAQKQRICDKMGIEIANLRQIESTTKIRKTAS